MPVLEKTAAVIVTFNRSAKLSNVLDALAVQTRPPEVIYVIDNASTDDTETVVRAKAMANLRYVKLPKNIGGAGGFHEGMKLAYKDGANYIWISDDDAYPEPDALERLQNDLAEFEDKFEWRPSFACSRVEWIDGSLCEMNTPHPVWDWARFLRAQTPWALVDSCSFVSVLIPRWAVREHGLPIAEYFIWFDDAEYTRRIAQSYPGIYCPESRVIHDTPENKGVNYSLVTAKSLWKFAYGARNETSFLRRTRGITGVVSFAYNVHRSMLAGNVPWAVRRKIYAAIVRGASFNPKIVKL
ncbi:glycosyl transferase [Thioclava sp. SK-1]|uniref:glycosyltransferase family 2 protein n=1 Tax=Thioclava sp. SK-1 TaxID=1889770 RepID=UPI000825D5CC|nr:glycosyltransferase family 2 protein [Thioclava sp. SK-1]OCX66437.1 glycosyl transferase [Thioclava sp. SK-1]